MPSTALTPRDDAPLVRSSDTSLAYVLWLGGFVGLAGLHRLYMGRTLSGLLWLCTFGFCFVGQAVDLLMMPRMIDDSNRGAGW